jgi:arylsulfatase A-like enzyme
MVRPGVTLLLGLLAAGCAPSPPNVVFILADDLGYGDLGSYGSERISTPHLDRMAAEGTRFTQAYSAGPICAPTRCGVMTGLHTGHCTVRDNLSKRQGSREERIVPLRDEDLTVAELLRARGYATGGFGKWGLGTAGTPGSPQRQGFDEFFGYLDQRHASEPYSDHLYRNDQRVEIAENRDGRRGRYLADLLFDEALSFVERHRQRPFFLYLPTSLPHPPFQAPDLGPYEATDWRYAHRHYAAMVSHLDGQVGRLLDRLDALGLSERTVVFLSSDNGPETLVREFFDSTAGLRGGKESLFEGALRVPMLVRWPGTVPAGRVSDAVWWQIDFLPTAAELAGTPVPPGLDGRSVADLLRGGHGAKGRTFYWELHRPFLQAARWGRWKGLRLAVSEPLQLYDLEADPGETTDRAADEPDVVARLEEILASSRSESAHWPVRRRGRLRPAS